MSTAQPPAELTPAAWERQAGALAKARPATVADALRALQKAHDLVPWELTQAPEALTDAAAAELRLAQLRSEGERRLRPLCQQAQAAGQAASKWLAAARKESATPKPALQAAEAIVRAGTGWAADLERIWHAALEAAEKRLAELLAAAKASDGKPEDTPERRRVRSRVIDQFRIVKNRPDRKVLFLLCLGHKSCAPYLGPTVSDAQKPLLAKVLKGDTGFKYFRGECIWEDGGYTFVGSRLSTGLARRIERGLFDLTGNRWRIRARE